MIAGTPYSQSRQCYAAEVIKVMGDSNLNVFEIADLPIQEGAKTETKESGRWRKG